MRKISDIGRSFGEYMKTIQDFFLLG